MLRYLTGRLFSLAFVLLAVSIIVFTLMHSVPGGPFDTQQGQLPPAEEGVGGDPLLPLAVVGGPAPQARLQLFAEHSQRRGSGRTRRSRSAASRSRRCDSAALARVKLARNLIFVSSRLAPGGAGCANTC